MSLSRLRIIAVAGLVALALAPAAVAGTAIAPDDPGCGDYYVDCGFGENDVGSVYETMAVYDSPDAVYGRCRTVHAIARRRNLAYLVVFEYVEQVRYCWNGSAVTYFWRDRWPQSLNFGWTFDGNVWTNCGPQDAEHCSGKRGAWAETAASKGQFHVCLVYAICKTKVPTVSITVYGNGAYSGSVSGA